MSGAGPAAARVAAARILIGVWRDGRKARDLFEPYTAALPRKDRAWVREAAWGVLRRAFSLEADVSRFLRRKPDDETRALLWLGAFQLRHMRTPAHAAVSASVDAARRLCPRAAGLVNAVLRRVAESEPPRRLKPHQRAELPQWLYRRWRDAFGADDVQAFAAAMLAPPPLCIAVTGDREAWLARARAAGVDAAPGRHAPGAVLIGGEGVEIAALPGYAEGAFVVMDQAAQMAVASLPPVDGGVVLDLCAAPGGKGALLAAGMPRARVLSVELAAARLPRMRENMQRMGQGNHALLRADAARLPLPDASVDCVLLDAPCTASGILRRHPDAKFLHAPEEPAVFCERQRRLIAEGLRVLRPGGHLLYAVCSIHPEENEGAIAPFADAVVEQRRLFPADDHDGFFIALMRKIG